MNQGLSSGPKTCVCIPDSQVLDLHRGRECVSPRLMEEPQFGKRSMRVIFQSIRWDG